MRNLSLLKLCTGNIFSKKYKTKERTRTQIYRVKVNIISKIRLTP